MNRLTSQGQIGTVCIRLAVLEQGALQVPVDKVVGLQHAHLGVLQNEESHMYGYGVRDGSLVHLDLVRIVDDDVKLSEPSIADHVVFHVTMAVHVVVGDGLPVALVPRQLRGVRDDGLVWVDVSLASGRGQCIAGPPEARDRSVLDNLKDSRHLESLVQVLSQEGVASKIL